MKKSKIILIILSVLFIIGVLLNYEEKDSMDFNEYQEWTKSTAIYPPEEAITYTTLGLISEAGEVAGKVKKIIRDAGGQVSQEQKDALKSELSDVCWYLARLSDELQIQFQDVVDLNGRSFNSDQKLSQIAIDLSKNASNVASVSAAYVNGRTTGNIENHIKQELNRVVYDIGEMAVQLDLTLKQILDYNVEKLESRKERNKLSGSGDNR